MIIDVHVHYTDSGPIAKSMDQSKFKIKFLRDKQIITIKGVTSIAYKKLGNIRKQIKNMEQAGVDMNVISTSTFLDTALQMTNESSYKIVQELNNVYADLQNKYPDKLIGLATIDPFDQEHLDEVNRAINELELKGVMVNTSLDSEFLDSPKTHAFFQLMEKLDVPIFLHPPHLPIGYDRQNIYKLEEMIGRPFDTTITVARMIYSGIFDRFPKLRIILPHMGGAILMLPGRLDFGYRLGYDGIPEREGAKCKKLPSEYLKNLYVDTMGFWAQGIELAIDTLGIDHVLFGTDHPAVPYSQKEHIDIIQSLNLPEDDEQKILGENAKIMFGIE